MLGHTSLVFSKKQWLTNVYSPPTVRAISIPICALVEPSSLEGKTITTSA